MTIDALECMLPILIGVLLVLSGVYLAESEVTRWFLSVVLWGAFVCATSIMIIFLHHYTTKKIEEKTFSVYSIEGTQYIKDGDELININHKFGGVFDETITLVRIDGDEKYWGFYPAVRSNEWKLGEK